MTLLKEDLGNQTVENIYQDLQIDQKWSGGTGWHKRYGQILH
jgi:hypothetical protein